ncbi:Maf family protein [Ancylobacter defluvii]|uniref:Nucleoside triphosphate pyrophosphatase n=1 Tax=Ancylobacter defluvii TaxID=1282440 RepID=A0A9W6JUQ5_9HYPH|nr:Maf family protein [Ancylobacter defluvii]MBS7587193.1 Maf family protein [Ancylobacter defluvii]GLK83507.1 Maf-like protein [Ancylobacter defluvii]
MLERDPRDANSLWQGKDALVLASKSIARLSLLAAAGLPVETVSIEVDERGIEARLLKEGASPAKIALELSIAKALAGSARHPGRLVIGADQTLALGDERFHKPANLEAAAQQLRRLAGHTHALHSGIAVALDGEIVFRAVESALLSMRELSERSLAAYLAEAGPTVSSSVGGYQLEGLGIHLFEKVAGNHMVILGLPLIQLLAFLRERGDLL